MNIEREQAVLDAVRDFALTGTFDEDKHPRHGKGSQGGGKFAPKGGSDTPVAKDPKAVASGQPDASTGLVIGDPKASNPDLVGATTALQAAVAAAGTDPGGIAQAMSEQAPKIVAAHAAALMKTEYGKQFAQTVADKWKGSAEYKVAKVLKAAVATSYGGGVYEFTPGAKGEYVADGPGIQAYATRALTSKDGPAVEEHTTAFGDAVTFAKEQYQITQAMLKEAPATVTLYRGVTLSSAEIKALKIGSVVPMKLSSLSSFSDDQSQADQFAAGGVTLSVIVPKSAVYANYMTGMGSGTEREWLLLGSRVSVGTVTGIKGKSAPSVEQTAAPKAPKAPKVWTPEDIAAERKAASKKASEDVLDTIVAWRVLQELRWDPEDHPREKDFVPGGSGKFADKGGGSGGGSTEEQALQRAIAGGSRDPSYKSHPDYIKSGIGGALVKASPARGQEQAYEAQGTVDDAAHWENWKPGPSEEAVLAQLAQVPAIVEAERVRNTAISTAKLYRDEQGHYTAERYTLQKRAIANITVPDSGQPMLNPLARVPDGETPTLALIIGPPGSGKSEVIRPVVWNSFDKTKFSIVDNDLIKAQLPEFDGGKNAEGVQTESGDMADKYVIPYALDERMNLVIDGVGKSAGKMMKTVRDFTAAGYKVYVYHVQTPPIQSVGTVIDRFGVKGRYVNPWYVAHEVGYRPSATYAKLKASGLVSGGISYDNGVPKGDAPRQRDQFGSFPVRPGAERAAGPRRLLGERDLERSRPVREGSIPLQGNDRQGADPADQSGDLGGDPGSEGPRWIDRALGRQDRPRLSAVERQAQRLTLAEIQASQRAGTCRFVEVKSRQVCVTPGHGFHGPKPHDPRYPVTQSTVPASATLDEDFESKHPRDHGKFTDKGGGEIAAPTAAPTWQPATPEQFLKAREQGSTKAAFLSPTTAADLTDHTLFVSDDGHVGFAVSPDGDVQNVFNNGGPPGAGRHALFQAIAAGGRTLDCFDKYLPLLYTQAGFVETGRLKWNDEYAPKEWDYEKYGRPDVVVMAWTGFPGGEDTARERTLGSQTGWIKRERSTQYYDDYDAAKADARGAAAPGGRGSAGRPAEPAGSGVDPGAGARDRGLAHAHPLLDLAPLEVALADLGRAQAKTLTDFGVANLAGAQALGTVLTEKLQEVLEELRKPKPRTIHRTVLRRDAAGDISETLDRVVE